MINGVAGGLVATGKALLWAVAMAVGFAVVVGLAGCREEEQRRPLSFEPGKYAGAPDEALTVEQREALRQRAGHRF